MDSFVILFSLFLLSLCSVSVIWIKDSLSLLLISSLVSLFCALSYVVLDAVDVAFTEVVVGGGISGAIFIVIIYLTKSYEFNKTDNTRYQFSRSVNFLYLFLFLILGGIFLDFLTLIPSFGNINNPSNNDIYQIYMKQSYETFKVPNAVTMVLGSFRGYDTLGETTVILIAGLGVYLILNAIALNNPNMLNNDDNSLFNNVFSQDSVLKGGVFALFSILLLYAFYVQFHGDFGPGGGFQAGVILSCAYILICLVFGYKASNSFINIKLLLILLSCGVGIYACVGYYTMSVGGKFLDYYFFGKDFSHSYHWGLFLIEFGVGLGVFGAMSIIVGQFYKKMDGSK